MKFIRKRDWIAAAVILAIAAVLYLVWNKASGENAIGEIYYNSVKIADISLGQGAERSFALPQNENVVFHLYKDGGISFESSDCPDKVCIRSGRLRKPGQSAACLPNRMVLKITSQKVDPQEPDLITG